MSYLKLTWYINDFSEVLDEWRTNILNDLFSDYKRNNWVEIATVFIKHRKWKELKDIALDIFNENWIWDKETNSWLLLIVVTEEKKIRIMTGKWMELEFPDSYCRDIIEWELRWLMNSWKYDELLDSWFGISTWLKIFTPSYNHWRKKHKGHSFGRINSILIIFVSLIMLILFWFFYGFLVEKTSKNSGNSYKNSSSYKSNSHYNSGKSRSTSRSSSTSSSSSSSNWWGWSSNGWGYWD